MVVFIPKAQWFIYRRANINPDQTIENPLPLIALPLLQNLLPRKAIVHITCGRCLAAGQDTGFGTSARCISVYQEGVAVLCRLHRIAGLGRSPLGCIIIAAPTHPHQSLPECASPCSRESWSVRYRWTYIIVLHVEVQSIRWICISI